MPETPRPPAPSSAPSSPAVLRLVLALAMLAVGLLAVLFGTRTALILGREATLAADNCYPESAVVLGVIWAARGEPVYRDLTGWDVPTNLYGPLTYYLPAWIGRAIGATDPASLRVIARWWSFVCYVGVGLLLAEIVATLRRRAGRPRSLTWPAAAALTFWIASPVPVLAVTTRCDTPFLLLNLLTVRVLLSFDARDDAAAPAWGLVLMGALILLSASFRQIVLGPPATIAVWLLARRLFLRTAVFCVAVPVVALGLLLLGDGATAGHLSENILKAGVVEFRLSTLRENFETIVAYLLLLGIPALLWCASSGASSGKSSGPSRPGAFAIFPWVSFPFAFLLAGKKGSSHAYYWETLMALVPAAMLAAEDELARWRDAVRGRAPLPREALLVAACLLLASLELGAVAGNDLVGMIREPRPTKALIEAEKRAIASFGDGVHGLPLRWSILLTGRPFISSDLFQHDLIVTSGQITWAPVTDALRAGRFPVLAVDSSVLQWGDLHALRAALFETYEPIPGVSDGLPTVSFWRPKHGTPGLPAATGAEDLPG